MELLKGLSQYEQSILLSLINKIELSKEDKEHIDNELMVEIFAYEGGISISEALKLAKDSCPVDTKIINIDNNYILVQWPESQELMDKEWFNECILGQDINNHDEIGSSAYFVPIKRIIEITE